jgi:hypothetical protein
MAARGVTDGDPAWPDDVGKAGGMSGNDAQRRHGPGRNTVGGMRHGHCGTPPHLRAAETMRLDEVEVAHESHDPLCIG